MPPRDLTHDYNVILSVGEIAVRHLLGGLYDANESSFVLPIDESTELHLRYEKPAIEFRTDHEHVRLAVPVLEGRLFSSAEPPPVDCEHFVAAVDIDCAIRSLDGDLCFDLGAGDVEVTVVVSQVHPNNTEEHREACAGILRGLILLQLAREEEPGEEEAPVDPFAHFREPLVGSDSLFGLRSTTTDPLEPVTVEVSGTSRGVLQPRFLQEPGRFEIPIDPYHVGFDPSLFHEHALERHSLNVCTFEEFSESHWRDLFAPDLEDETRGEASAPVECLVAGSQLTVRISQPVVEQIIADALRDAFMRMVVTVSDTHHVENGVNVWEPRTLPESTYWSDHSFVFLSAHRPRAGAQYDTPANVHGFIFNLTKWHNEGDGHTVSFVTEADGYFAEMIEAESGDVLLFWGDYFTYQHGDRTVIGYPPQVALREGELHASGELTIRKNTDIDASYSGSITFRVNTHGDIVSSTDVDLELPGWLRFVDILLMCFPAGSLFHTWLGGVVSRAEGTVEGEAGALLVDSLTGMFFAEEIERDGLLHVALEDLAIHDNGIVVSGQLEAGNLRSTGLVEGEGDETSASVTARIDEWRVEDPWRSDACFGCGDALVRPPTRPRWVDFTLTGSTETGIDIFVSGIPSEGDVEELGLADLDHDHELGHIDVELLKTHEYPSRSLHFELGERAHEDFDRRVFAVRLPSGSYAKVRLELQSPRIPRLRWVTYEPQPRPLARIAGNWCKDTDETTTREGMFRRHVSGADLYWGDHLALEIEGLHVPRLTTTWELSLAADGPDEGFPLGVTLSEGGLSAELEIDTRILPERYFDEYGLFSFFLRAEAQDVFGRRASAVRELRGSLYREILERIIPGLDEGRDDDLRRPPDESTVKVVIPLVESTETQLASAARSVEIEAGMPDDSTVKVVIPIAESVETEPESAERSVEIEVSIELDVSRER